jgi:hypothetical protein
MHLEFMIDRDVDADCIHEIEVTPLAHFTSKHTNNKAYFSLCRARFVRQIAKIPNNKGFSHDPGGNRRRSRAASRTTGRIG